MDGEWIGYGRGVDGEWTGEMVLFCRTVFLLTNVRYFFLFLLLLLIICWNVGNSASELPTFQHFSRVKHSYWLAFHILCGTAQAICNQETNATGGCYNNPRCNQISPFWHLPYFQNNRPARALL